MREGGLKMEDFSKDIRHRGMSKEEMIMEIQRLLLKNDYEVGSVFETTKYMKENLRTSIEWILGRKDVNIPEKDKKFIPKKSA